MQRSQRDAAGYEHATDHLMIAPGDFVDRNGSWDSFWRTTSASITDRRPSFSFMGRLASTTPSGSVFGRQGRPRRHCLESAFGDSIRDSIEPRVARRSCEGLHR
jgi:hypothetical protein